MTLTRRQSMARLAAAGGVMLLPSLAAAQDRITGTFAGVLAVGDQRLRLRLVIDPAGDRVALFSVDQGNVEIPATEVAITGNSVSLDFASIGARFSGRFYGIDRIEGEFIQGGQSFPLNFMRGPFAAPSAEIPALTQAVLDDHRQQHGTPGVIAAYAAGEGAPVMLVSGIRRVGSPDPVTVADKWHLGSITKSMTATMIARLVEAGRLRWDSSVDDVLGERIADMRPEYRAATLLHLLSHRSGMPANIDIAAITRFTAPPLADSSAERLRYATMALAMPAEAPLAERMIYSNNGYIVAGAMAEAATGQGWETLMQDLLFTPLNLASAGFGPPRGADQPTGHVLNPDLTRTPTGIDNPAALGPAGLVHMQMADVLRYLTAHRDRPVRLLSAEHWTRLHTPPFGGPYALGWTVSPDGSRLWHNGSNGSWYADVSVNRTSGVIAAFAANDGANNAGGPSPMLRAAIRAASPPALAS